MFGGAKPATTGFGSTATTGGNMFGGGASTSGFGGNAAGSSNPFASNTTSAFGSNTTNTATTGFGASNSAVSSNTGTGSVPFQAWTEREPTGNVTSHYQSITFQEPYKNKSFEELRVEDYLQGRKFGNTNGQAGAFGQTSGFGGSGTTFGNNAPAAPSGGLFGGAATANTTPATGGFAGFGSANNTTPSTAGFGANAGGGLFGGANKPATGGSLFGSSAAPASTGFGASTSGSTGGIFGGGNTGFGANANTNTTNTGGGLFGNNNATQNKPAFGGFGGGAATTNTTAFGANTNTASTGGLFGSSNTNTNNTGTSLFGNNAAQQPASNPFGGSTNNNNTGGLFGSAKPATGGLFGSSTSNANTGGSLFGNAGTQQNNNNQPQQNTGSLFGGAQTNNSSGGLFGSSTQAKPSTGLFGGNTTTATGGSNLFGGGGGNNTQQPAGNSLFGNNNNSGGSLFGNSQSKPATGSLFGGATQNNNSGNSLFGNNQQTTQQGGGGGGGLFASLGTGNSNQQTNNNSMFGSSFGQSTNQNSQSQLHANLTVSPYGNDQLFSSLATASAPVGPLATPLAGARPTPSKTQSLLSSTRLNSPIYTPRASAVGRNPGYGFSYSTYGTPGSAYSVSVTPQASSLLKPTGSLGSALTSRLAKSMSMNNLRSGDSTPREGESLLRPTPGSASSRYLNSGNMRKLTIDRSLRHELFSPPTEQRQPEHRRLEATRENDPPALGKKVSFDEKARPSDAEPTATNALVRTEEPEEDDSPRNLYRSSEKTPANGTTEMQQVNGKPLRTVFEDGEQQRPASAPGHRSTEIDPTKEVEIGDYWTKPSIKDLKNMGRESLKKLGGVVVGRTGVGRIEFSACDLSSTDLDEICGQDNGKGIVHLKPRSATVYPNEATKPARGKGLNVPSKIFLENSWPKSHGGKKIVMPSSGPAYDKHVRRLKKTGGTKFIDYDASNGTWSFSVEHFTTYELDDSDDDDETTMDMEQQDSSGLSDAPATPGQDDDTMQSIETGDIGAGEVDDTFEFKINQRSISSATGANIPGGFDESHISYDYDDPSADEDVNEEFMMSGGLGNAEEDPFASPGGAVQPPSPQAYERFQSSMLDEHAGADQITEDMQDEPERELLGSFMPEEPKLLRSILKPTARASAFASPQKLATETWEDQLQRTMSPKKRDRQHLREIQQSLKAMNEPQEDFIGTPFKRSMLGRSALGQSYLAQKSAKKVGFGNSTMQVAPADMGKSQAFRTSMDIMNSLWSQEKSGKNGFAAERSFEV